MATKEQAQPRRWEEIVEEGRRAAERLHAAEAAGDEQAADRERWIIGDLALEAAPWEGK